MLNTL